MERNTVDIYETQAAQWIASRAQPCRVDAAEQLQRRAHAVHPDRPIADVGCGPGGHFPVLGPDVVGIDAAPALLDHARTEHPGAHVVQADLMALPFRRQSFGGAWARMSYHHIPRASLPMALAHLHLSLAVGAPLCLVSQCGDDEGATGPNDEFPGRYFACWQPAPLTDVLTGAGFDVESCAQDGDEVVSWATRARTLPDTVGPDMRLLVCGLNPSEYSADRGAGFARRANRFWPAMIAAGLVCPDRAWDPLHLLTHHRIGMTDMVKRATVASSALSKQEYGDGAERVRRLVEWLQPAAVCFVGLEGWRAAVDRKATAGWQPKGLGGVPAYVMPSTSGLNASSRPADLAEHLRAAAGRPTA
jgi:TDG/mug DNA glycosylase family protein